MKKMADIDEIKEKMNQKDNIFKTLYEALETYFYIHRPGLLSNELF